ncbi:thiamine-phosphate pyrophosphorylase [bacterium]|nr:thiamine-phosphate pyrophosphorylase [bacterium]
MTDKRKIARIIDANLNRAREGSRVLEETARFINDDGSMAKQIKDIRHDIVATVKEFGFDYLQLLDARDSESDVGREQKGKLEIERSGLKDIIAANFSRVEEALRVIEEYGRPVNQDAADKIKNLRYHVYTLEKAFNVAKDGAASSGDKRQSPDCVTPIIVLILIAAAVIYFFYFKPA